MRWTEPTSLNWTNLIEAEESRTAQRLSEAGSAWTEAVRAKVSVGTVLRRSHSR